MASVSEKKEIQTRLLQWYEKNGRKLPWRKTRDPYAIWVSEIMLQQTQVSTVIPYYQKFMKSFPTIRHLAKADLSSVLKVWEGLGYYSRARNLHLASRIVSNDFHGKIPGQRKDLLALPGIGRYTAGAVLSIAFNKEAPILDGNVKRVISRLFAISNPDAANGLSLRRAKRLRDEAEANSENPRFARNRLHNPSGENGIAAPFAKTCQFDKSPYHREPSGGKGNDLLWRISESLIPKGEAGSFNQGLMDLGAMICTPKAPQCPRCPLHNLCKGRASGDPERFPANPVKKKIPRIEAISAVILKNGRVLLRQRPPKGLLGGLWEFPNWKIEGNGGPRLKLQNYIKKNVGMIAEVRGEIGTFRQTFTHFKLTLHVYNCEAIDGGGKGKWVFLKDLPLFPMSRIHRRIAERLDVENLTFP